MKAFWRLFYRDCLLYYRSPSDCLYPLCFFFLVTLFFPLALGGDPALLRAIGVGVVWVANLLASLLSLERLFKEDYDDGSLQGLLLCDTPLAWLVLAKCLAHTLVFGVFLLLASPLLLLLFYLPVSILGVLMLALFIGGLLFMLWGALIAALTVSLRNNGLLFALLVLPLYVPVLIFGSGSVMRALQGFSWEAPLLLLFAFLLLALGLVPPAAAFSLRLGARYDVN